MSKILVHPNKVLQIEKIFFVIKPKAKLGRFLTLIECKIMLECGGAFSDILARRLRRALRGRLQQGSLGRGGLFT